MSEQKIPHNVRCDRCGHVWVGLYLPMLVTDAVRVMQALTCPMCAASAKCIKFQKEKTK